MRLVLILLVFSMSILNFGCVSAMEAKVSVNKDLPLEYKETLVVRGDIEVVSKYILKRFSKDINSFYKTEVGIKLNKQFTNANSTFDLGKVSIFPANAGIHDKNNKSKRSSARFVLNYIQERITPSYEYKGNFAKSIGGFELVAVQIEDNMIRLSVNPRDLQVKGKFDCSLFHGIQCGRTASRVTSAPFEENLILKYIQYVLSKMPRAIE